MVLVFRGDFFVLTYPLRLVENDGRNTAGVVTVMVFLSSGIPFTPFHNLGQLNVLLEATVLGDGWVEGMEFVGVIGEPGTLSLLQLRPELSNCSGWNGLGWFGGGLRWHNRGDVLRVRREVGGLVECIRGDETAVTKQQGPLTIVPLRVS